MKPFFVIIIALVYSHFGYSQTQKDSAQNDTKSNIKLYPLQLISGEFWMGYEMPIKRNV